MHSGSIRGVIVVFFSKNPYFRNRLRFRQNAWFIDSITEGLLSKEAFKVKTQVQLEFGLLDYIVLVGYLIGVACLGIYAAGRQSSTNDYFMGGKDMPWWAVLLSVVATETSTLTFISIPAVSYGSDITFLQITFGYILGRIVVSMVFLPAYYEGKLTTAYQYLATRFGASMRNITSSTFMVTRLLADGVRLFATAIPLAVIFRLGGAFTEMSDLHVYLIAIAAIAGITIVYTFIGGIKAVVWMDVMQMTIYVGGAILAIFILIFNIPDGLTGAMGKALSEGKLNLIDFGESVGQSIQSPYAFFTAVIGGAIFSLASHGTDHLIVQRLLTTKTLRDSQKALIGSGLVACAQFAMFLFIGLLLYSFYDGQTPEALGLSNMDEIFAMFIIEHLPIGISGLIVAALLAAAMSSLSSSLNSLASATTLDLYKPYFGKDNSESKDLWISRGITVFWGFVITGSAFLFALIQTQAEGEQPAVVELGLEIASYTYGGLLGAFLFGLFTNKPNLTDAIIGFFAGLLAMLYLVEGVIQEFLPGTGLAVAWPLYTLVGSVVVLSVGTISYYIRTRFFSE